MTNDELVEKVAIALYDQRRLEWAEAMETDYKEAGQIAGMFPPYAAQSLLEKQAYRYAARAAIAVVLEEAAKVAEAFPARTHGHLATAPYAAAEQAAEEIAAAIRAMIPKEGE